MCHCLIEILILLTLSKLTIFLFLFIFTVLLVYEMSSRQNGMLLIWLLPSHMVMTTTTTTTGPLLDHPLRLMATVIDPIKAKKCFYYYFFRSVVH
jgi:hypothetical protein